MEPPATVIPLDTRRSARVGQPLAAREDDELMLLARGGIEEAFDELVRRHQTRVLRIAAKHIGSEEEARDIGQCAFLELYRELGRYEARGKLSAYLYRLVLNQCRMAVRARRNRYKKHAAAAFAIVPPAVRLADDEILAREKRREVDRALAGLSDKLRDVVVLRYAGELSYREIADTLKLPLGTVKSRLFAALEKLAAILDGDAT